MTRKPSIETQLREEKREHAQTDRYMRRAYEERDKWQRIATERAGLLIEAQAERDEWKARFDALLARVPKTETAS